MKEIQGTLVGSPTRHIPPVNLFSCHKMVAVCCFVYFQGLRLWSVSEWAQGKQFWLFKNKLCKFSTAWSIFLLLILLPDSGLAFHKSFFASFLSYKIIFKAACWVASINTASIPTYTVLQYWLITKCFMNYKVTDTHST